MKKIFAVLAGLMTYSAVYALPVYNPDQPELLKYGVFTCGDNAWGLEFGYRGDFVFDRQIKIHNNNGNLSEYHKDLSVYRQMTNAGQITLNLWDRIDVYGWAGAVQSEFDADVNYLTAQGAALGFTNLRGRTQDGFAWGVGARAVLWQCGRTALGIDAQYSHSEADLQALSVNGVPVQAAVPFGLDPSRFSLRNREYQVSLGISHRICWLVPYVAVKYSNVRPEFEGPLLNPTSTVATFDPDLDFRSRNCVGFVFGVSLIDADRMHVTAEGRFIDEKALTVAADIRF